MLQTQRKSNSKNRSSQSVSQGVRRILENFSRLFEASKKPDRDFSNQPVGESELKKIRKEVEDAVSQLTNLIHGTDRGLPTHTGDGTDLPDKDPSGLSKIAREAIEDFSTLGITDYETLFKVLESKIDGQPTNDKTYFMEYLIRTAAKLPDDSQLGKDVTTGFLSQLWNDLEHPPQAYLDRNLQYRQADGSGNSLTRPQLGAAGTAYARTVKPVTLQSASLPDPGVVFDSLFARKVHEKHPNEISSMLFYLASIIIHDLFRTDHYDYRISNTSSYLDLSPLYGSNAAEQRSMRTYTDGKIKPDCFSETRLLLFPPGVSILLIMFNRFHNYVVEQLASINENGRFAKPVDGAHRAKTWEEYDEDLFQTGRLVTCGLYVNCILLDYVRTILNINQTDSNWVLNPRLDVKGLPKGMGNQVSAEFNLVYRWHASISDKDEKWTDDLFAEMFPGKDAKDVSKTDLLMKFAELEKNTPEDPIQRPVHGIKRNNDGTLDEDAMVKILIEGIEDCANSFGAQRVPVVMRAIEILGIEQARSWNVATLNELRKYFSLTPHRTFEDINPDPYVAEQLKRLYDHPDLVEMYPGLVAESAKQPMTPGAGLVPSFTVSRAVLSDAVALVRGDRFYTTDYHPKSLTNWGYSLVQSDPSIDHGCVFSKLFLRAFPNRFKANSVYVHYPLTVPSKMKEVLTALGNDKPYDFSRPEEITTPKLVFSYAAAEKIMGDKVTFNVTWGAAMEFLMGPDAKNFMLSGDGHANEESRKLMSDALYVKPWEAEVKSYYLRTTEKLLHEKSYKLGDLNQVDIIRDVSNLVHVHFAADLWSLPLKTKDNPHGVFTEHDLYLILAGTFTVVFFDLDPASSFPLRQKAYAATQALGKLVELKVRDLADGGVLSKAAKLLYPSKNALTEYGDSLLKRLLTNGIPVHELVWGHIMGTLGGMVPNQGQLLGQTLEFYLTDGKMHLPEIQRLAKLDDEESFDTLMHYLMEGGRLNGEVGVMRRVTASTEVEDNGRVLSLAPGDEIMVHLRAVSRDPVAFPEPDEVRLDRPLERYMQYGAGPHRCLGLGITRVAQTATFKVIMARLDGLRVAAGPQGVVKKVTTPLAPLSVEPDNVKYHKYLTELGDGFFPFPCSLKVNWDNEL